jgi:hypothetical protein
VPGSKVRFVVDLSKFGAVRNLPELVYGPGDDAKWQSISWLILNHSGLGDRA